jgi:ATP-binding cassette subfamily C protein
VSAVGSCLPEATVRQTLRTVGSLLGGRLGALAVAVAAFTVGSAAALVVPVLQGRIVDDVIDGRGLGRVAFTVSGIVVAGVVAAILVLWGGRLLVRTLQAVLAGLREDVLEAAVNLDTTDVENAGSSDVVSRITGDVESVTTAVTEVLPRTTQSLFTLLVTALGFAVLDPWLALAALVAVPVQLLSGVVFLRRSRPLYVRQQRMDAERGQALIETVNGAQTVCAHAEEDARLGLIAARSLAAVEIGRAATKVRNVFNGGLNTAEFLGLAAVLCVGFWRVDAGALTVGAATAGALFFQRIFAPVSVLLAGIDDLQRAEVGLARLVGVLVAPRSVHEPQTVADCAGRLPLPVEIRGHLVPVQRHRRGPRPGLALNPPPDGGLCWSVPPGPGSRRSRASSPVHYDPTRAASPLAMFPPTMLSLWRGRLPVRWSPRNSTSSRSRWRTTCGSPRRDATGRRTPRGAEGRGTGPWREGHPR